ncbi:MAG: PAS domain S-box protein [Gemmatimonadota bacterium]|nr:PAS domain S-box protein [Gemmatimonadota bacterium]MDH5758572.1 PAS domain S-box protein [Gemmatimonadota bacterium]
MRVPLSLRFLVPLFLVAGTGIALVGDLIIFGAAGDRAVEEEALREVPQFMSLLQGNVSLLMRRGDSVAVRGQLASIRTDPTLLVAVILDEEGRVRIVPTRNSPLPESELAMAAGWVRDGLRVGRVTLTEDRDVVVAVYPVSPMSTAEGLGSREPWYLVVSKSLARRQVAVARQVKSQILVTALWYTGMAAILALLFNGLVTRRARRLEGDALALASGDLSVRSEVSGGDEIGHLATAFNEMANSLQERASEVTESRARFKAVFDESALGIAMVDLEGRPIMINRALQRLVGYSLEELSRIGFEAVTHPDFIEERREQFRKLLAAEIESFQSERRYLTRDGREVPVRITTSLLRDAGGNPEGAVGLVEDLSSRVAAEKERDLLQRQLQQAQKMEALGQMTGGVAHDFNNILAVIMGRLELLRRRLADVPDPAVVRSLDAISGAGDKARTVVGQLLAFSRGEGGVAEQIDLREMVRDVVALMRPTLPSSIELVEAAGDVPCLVDAASVQIHQVLVNLILNSRDAVGGKGTITIDLSVLPTGGRCDSCHGSFSGPRTVLTVSDDGSGIPEEVLARMFEPFYSTKEVGSGSGMGLAMVHGIVHQWGGHVQVESGVGAGTKISLFFNATEMEWPGAPVPGVVAERPRRESGASPRVMVVDDQEEVAELFEEVLQISGFEVVRFSDSREARDYIESHAETLDAVVTDQTMPGLTGCDLAEFVASRSPWIPVVLLSGHSDVVNADTAGDLGVSRYLAKPVQMDVLIDTVREVVEAAAEG